MTGWPDIAAAWTAMDKHGGREQGTFVTGIFKEVMDRGSVGGLPLVFFAPARGWSRDLGSLVWRAARARGNDRRPRATAPCFD